MHQSTCLPSHNGVVHLTEYVLEFPGMPRGSFVAHLDAASGRRVYGLQDPPLSPKMALLLQMISQLRADANRKCLVFSQSRQLLELAATLLEKEYGGSCFSYAKEGGQASLDAFNSAPYTLHPASFTLHPVSCTLYPAG